MPRQPKECVDSDISGDTPHQAEAGHSRCAWHREKYEAFLATNRQRKRRLQAPLRWQDKVRPRPTRVLPVELSQQQVEAIRAAVAEVASEKAPLDALIGNQSDRFRPDDVAALVQSVNGLLDALREVTRRT